MIIVDPSLPRIFGISMDFDSKDVISALEEAASEALSVL